MRNPIINSIFTKEKKLKRGTANVSDELGIALVFKLNILHVLVEGVPKEQRRKAQIKCIRVKLISVCSRACKMRGGR